MAALSRSARRHTHAAAQVLSAEKLVLLLAGLQLCGGQSYRHPYGRHYSPAGGFHTISNFPTFHRAPYVRPGAQFLPVRGLHKRLALISHTPFGNGKNDNVGPSPQVLPVQSGFAVKPVDTHAMSSQAGAGSELVHIPASGVVGYDVGNMPEAYTSSLNQMALPGPGTYYKDPSSVLSPIAYHPGFGALDEEKSVGQVKIQVYRGPTVKAGHGYFAPWGYYVWQPSGTETMQSAFEHI